MAAHNAMHNLTTLIKRLEAATSRLEDIASAADLPTTVLPSAQAAAVESLPNARTVDKAPPVEPLPESIEDYDAFMSLSLDNFIKLSHQLGGLVAKQADEVYNAFQAQRNFLLITAKAVKPEPTIYQELLKPTNEALVAVESVKEANRDSSLHSNLSAVADGIIMLAWVTVENRPYKHVEESLGSAQFFGNRVLKEHKDKDPQQIEWIQSFYQLFHGLSAYIRQHFSSGITWNARGEQAVDVANTLSTQSSTHSFPAAVAPPPPPPPGPAPLLDIKPEPLSVPAATTNSGFDAVFSELNKGSAVTQGLRKVDRSENKNLRPSRYDAASRAKSPAPGKKPKPESMRAKKPPKKQLEGNKWIMENYDKEPQPIEIEASLTQSVLISRCNNTTIIIKGKANQVTVENSSRLSLVVDTLVSTVDVVKAQNLALQVLGTIPTVLLDQVDGAQIFLSKESSNTKVFISKSAGINLNVITGPDDDYKEVPLPSQICCYYDDVRGDLASDIVAYAG
ncbi:hypothetical protein CDD81_5020 [Ophiocordyceps australis]|uniref:Adenylyl cyclase-associated protein n=1 Tax=Ophiocordyceps australis TaxID=1399860 RepID=A0A2C5X6X0_9HYPO|nr:hypothetical protein CDD81_5020 [Ophiocordyceps australis]